MSAYFSIVFELNKSETAIRDFYNALNKSGAVFESAYYEEATLEDILQWNQNKLDKDFILGLREHFSHDYKQMLLKFGKFSEVRLYIINHKKEPTFSFRLIVEENDLFIDEKINNKWITKNNYKAMELLKKLSTNIWNNIDLVAIQTEWENTVSTPMAKEFSRKINPNCLPFCIVKKSLNLKIKNTKTKEIGKEGILFESDEW